MAGTCYAFADRHEKSIGMMKMSWEFQQKDFLSRTLDTNDCLVGKKIEKMKLQHFFILFIASSVQSLHSPKRK